MEQKEKVYLTVEEVAGAFEISPTTVYHLAQQRKLPGFKVGGQWRFSRQVLQAWVMDRICMEEFRREVSPPVP